MSSQRDKGDECSFIVFVQYSAEEAKIFPLVPSFLSFPGIHASYAHL